MTGNNAPRDASPRPEAPLRPGAYALLAGIAALIGLASSAVTAQFFILGLERMEADSGARQALVAAGLLIVVTELAAFGLAALLPRQALRGLRAQLMLCGALLLGFEAVTVYMTQATLVRAGDARATAHASRLADLRASIDHQRAAGLGLREGGVLQSASASAWTRQLGALALRDALRVEQSVLPLAEELARLEATLQPTMSEVLGAQGMLAYTVTRALLVSVMGLVMFGAAGALLRAAREAAQAPPVTGGRLESGTVTPGVTVGAAVSVPPVTPVPLVTPPAPRVPSYRHGVTATPSGWAACLPSLRFIAIPMAALAVSAAPAAAVPAREAPPGVTAPSRAESRYQRVRHGVMAGHIKPSVRGIQARAGGGTVVVRGYLQRLQTEGVTARSGQGWMRTPAV